MHKQLCIMKYWYEIMSSSNLLTTLLYEQVLEGKIRGTVRAYVVKSLLDNYGFTYEWNNVTVIDLSSVFFSKKEC